MSYPSFWRQVLLLLVMAGATVPLSAQPAGPRISFSIGPITHASLLHDTRYVLAPELQVSHGLVHVSEAGLSLRGAIYSSFWHDGGEKSVTCVDCIRYSYNTYTIGARMSLVAERAFPVPVYLFGGTSYHALYAEYVGGAGIDGRPGADYRDPFWAIEAGGGVDIPIRSRWHLGSTAQAVVPVSTFEQRSYQRQLALKIRVGYSFR